MSDRSDSKKLGINKITFSKYYELPGIIFERLFAVFDQDKNEHLDLNEFVEGMKMLFCESFDKLARFIFYFYDFDKDGFITKEDVRTVLSYVPLNTDKLKSTSKYDKEEFKDRVESQDELHLLLDKCFKQNEQLDIQSFLHVIENVSSDIFLFILIFLLERRPFSKKTMSEFENKKKFNNNPLLKFAQTPQVTMSRKLIASPSMNSKFSPSVSISKSPYMNKRELFKHTTPSLVSDKQSLLNKLTGRGTSETNSSKNVLLKYSAQGQNVKESLGLHKVPEKKEEDAMQVDENVQIKALPVFRKIRNNLKTLESLSPSKMNVDSEMTSDQMAEVDNLQVLSARKYQGNIGVSDKDNQR